MHIHMTTYIHTSYEHTCIHTSYKHTYIHTYIIQTYIHAYMQAVQIILRRTLFKDRLERGSTQALEYARTETGGDYVGEVRLPLLGKVRV